MISHRHKCIFIHIPKCAGTSVETALGHFDGHNGRNGQDHRSMRMIEQPYLTYNSIRSIENIEELMRRQKNKYFFKSHNKNNKLELTQQQYDSYYKFTIVRNPWDRAVSWYKNVMRDEVHKKKYNITGEMSFKEFMYKFAGKGMLRPQVYWLKNFNGDIDLDYVARFETLIEDVSKVFKELGLVDVELPHKIKSESSVSEDLICDEVNHLICEVYKRDIECFGYNAPR